MRDMDLGIGCSRGTNMKLMKSSMSLVACSLLVMSCGSHNQNTQTTSGASSGHNGKSDSTVSGSVSQKMANFPEYDDEDKELLKGSYVAIYTEPEAKNSSPQLTNASMEVVPLKGSFWSFVTGSKKSKKRSQAADSSKGDDSKSLGTIVGSMKSKSLTIGTAVEGETPFANNETQTFIPASTTKVVTSAVTLEQYGADFRYKSYLMWMQSKEAGPSVAANLVLYGPGDPTVGMDEFSNEGRLQISEIGKILKKSGITSVIGPIRLQSIDARWDRPVPAPGTAKEDYLAKYGHLSQAFNFNENRASLVVTGLNSSHWISSTLKFPIEYDMASGKRVAVAITPVWAGDGSMESLRVSGSWAGRRGRQVGATLPIYDVKSWMRNQLIEEIKKQGIAWNETEVASSEFNIQQTVSFASAPLSDILKVMNKHSNNFLADTLFKTSALKWKEKDIPLREAGEKLYVDSIEKWMKENGTPELAKELNFVDGSGLSFKNSVTPSAFMAVLKVFTKKPWFQSLLNSLPIAGVDGTLARRMRGTAAQGLIRAKTGTLRGSYQLVGYAPRFKEGTKEVEEYVPFVILTATTPGNMARVKAFQGRIGAHIVKMINKKTKS